MLKLVQTDWGDFELALIEASDDEATVNAVSVVNAVLFTDQKAPEDRVDDRFDRRGWWFDPGAGTGLWYVKRQALTDAARRETVLMVKRALDAQAGMTGIEVVQASRPASAGNISSVALDIQGFYDGTEFHIAIPDTRIGAGKPALPVLTALSDTVWSEGWSEGWSDDLLVADALWSEGWAEVWSDDLIATDSPWNETWLEAWSDTDDVWNEAWSETWGEATTLPDDVWSEAWYETWTMN